MQFPGDWTTIFTGLDLGAIMAIGVIAYFAERSERVGDTGAALLALALGAVWGAVIGTVEATTPLPHAILRGILVNGAAASVAARLAAKALPKVLNGQD